MRFLSYKVPVRLGNVLCYILTPMMSIVVVVGCSDKQKKEEKNQVKHYLIDEEHPLGQIHYVEQVGEDAHIVQDNTGRLSYFRQFRFTHVIGNAGRGPGEYMRSTYFQLVGDTVSILDRTLGKFIQYSLSTNRVFQEHTAKELSLFTAFYVHEGRYYFLSTIYNQASPDDFEIFYMSDDFKNFKALGLTVEQLASKGFLAPVQTRVPLAALQGKLYVALPLSNQITVFDIEGNHFSAFDLKLAQPFQKEFERLTSPAEMMRVIRKVDMCVRLFALEDQIVAVTASQGPGRIQYYSPSGEVSKEFLVTGSVVAVDKKGYWTLETESDVSVSQYPYVLVYHVFK